MADLFIPLGSSFEEPLVYENPILLGLREYEADPEKWLVNLVAYTRGDWFPFRDDVLDNILTEHDIEPSDPLIQHAAWVLAAATGTEIPTS